MSAHPLVDQCVAEWLGCKITRAEVVLKLLSLPTLDAQVELLSQLPEFVEEAKESVRHLSADYDKTTWFPGPGIPSTAKPRSPQEAAAFEQLLDDIRRSDQRLYDHLFGTNAGREQ